MQKKLVTNKRFILLVVLMFIAFIAGARFGAVQISPDEMYNAIHSLFSQKELTLNEKIFLEIRLPRALMCIVTGAALATGGVLLQALFRNPLLDPGLIGTSGGAAFGASIYLVMGPVLGLGILNWGLPFFAFGGALLSTGLVLLFSYSRESGKHHVVTLLLVGIAISALFMSGVGLMSYLARDPQARSITFWNLGTLSGANWQSLSIMTCALLICLIPALRLSSQLNTLMLGEDEAYYLGVNLTRLKWQVLVLNTLMIAVITSFVGVISFVGLIVPHLLRILFGPDNRDLIPGAAVAGALILSLSDLVSRVLLQPAELPIGIVTSIVGVPVFIVLIRSGKYNF